MPARFGGFDDERAGRGLEFAAVDCEFYQISH